MIIRNQTSIDTEDYLIRLSHIARSIIKQFNVIDSQYSHITYTSKRR
jgi:hypothetical protein